LQIELNTISKESAKISTVTLNICPIWTTIIEAAVKKIQICQVYIIAFIDFYLGALHVPHLIIVYFWLLFGRNSDTLALIYAWPHVWGALKCLS
jgi:hypothetical protein